MKILTPASFSLRGRLGFLLKDSILYGGAAAIAKSFSLITFPLLAGHLSVADYGVLDYFLVLSGFMATMFVFGQDSAVARYFYENEDVNERCQIISQSLVFQLCCLVLFLPIFWWTSDWAAYLFIESSESSTLFKLVLLQIPFLLLVNFSQNLLKWTFARARFLTMSLGFTSVQALLLLVAVLFFDAGIAGILLASLVASSIFGSLGLIFVREWLVIPENFKHLRTLLPFAVPFGIICVVGAFSPTLERTLTADLLGTVELGLYAAGTKMAMLIGLVVTAFQTAWGPFSLSLYKQNDAVDTYNWVFRLFAFGMCLMVFVLAMSAESLIGFLASARYEGAAVVVFPLALGLAIQATSWITEIGISISKRSHLNLYGYAFYLAITLVGILLLAPSFGLLGVGFSVLLGLSAKAITGTFLAQRAYPMTWQYFPVIIIFGLTLVTGLLAVWVEHHWGDIGYVSILAVGFVIICVVGWFKLFTRNERARIISIALKILRLNKRS